MGIKSKFGLGHVSSTIVVATALLLCSACIGAKKTVGFRALTVVMSTTVGYLFGMVA